MDFVMFGDINLLFPAAAELPRKNLRDPVSNWDYKRDR